MRALYGFTTDGGRPPAGEGAAARRVSPALAAAAALGGRAGRFGLVGALATALQYLTLVALVQGSGADPVAASAAGFCLSAALNYWLNYRFTFRSRARHREALAKFAAIAGMGLLWNSLVMQLATAGLGAPYLAAQLAATAAILLWNFLGGELWTFRA